MDGGAWWATVHEVAKSWTRLSVFMFFIFTLPPLRVPGPSVRAVPSPCFPFAGGRPVPATFPRLSWKTPVSPLLLAARIHSWSAAAPPSGLRTSRLVAHL